METYPNNDLEDTRARTLILTIQKGHGKSGVEHPITLEGPLRIERSSSNARIILVQRSTRTTHLLRFRIS